LWWRVEMSKKERGRRKRGCRQSNVLGSVVFLVPRWCGFAGCAEQSTSSCAQSRRNMRSTRHAAARLADLSKFRWSRSWVDRTHT
jgi:hypothetical protein